MFSKWVIKGIGGFVFGEDKKLYKLPFKNKGRSYSLREIKKQNKNRYKINEEWWSEKQLKPLLYLDPEPVELFSESDMPF